jgi:hypothetical protein
MGRISWPPSLYLSDLPPLRRHVAVDLALGDLGAVLLYQPLPYAAGGMALLARCFLVFAESLVDRRPVWPQLRCRPAPRRPLWRRDCGLQRLADGPAVDAVPSGQRPDRQSLARSIAPDLLELLHSCHSLPTSALRSIERSASVVVRTEVGPVQASIVGPVEMSTPRKPVYA